MSYSKQLKLGFSLKMMIFCSIPFSVIFILWGCEEQKEHVENECEVVVLGIAQDAGYPQIDCEKACCQAYYDGERKSERVVSLGLIDRKNKKSFLVEATPNIVSQWQTLKSACPECEISGIIITHAHIGHYTGLMHMGREALGAKNLPVYVMPNMAEFLKRNGPWSQLVKLENIVINKLSDGIETRLTNNLAVTSNQVPHRDEFSETVGFTFKGVKKQLLFIPDIDKWNKWESSISDLVINVDYALLDGTFYDNQELLGRDMSEIPHPFIVESIDIFKSLDVEDREKIHFIHFNHTNSVMDINSEKRIFASELGMTFCFDGQYFGL
ncbi:MAG: pyrroloquinoline quinone biosynthesis protein PqqB [Bacteroidia bacterium]